MLVDNFVYCSIHGISPEIGEDCRICKFENRTEFRWIDSYENCERHKNKIPLEFLNKNCKAYFQSYFHPYEIFTVEECLYCFYEKKQGTRGWTFLGVHAYLEYFKNDHPQLNRPFTENDFDIDAAFCEIHKKLTYNDIIIKYRSWGNGYRTYPICQKCFDKECFNNKIRWQSAIDAEKIKDIRQQIKIDNQKFLKKIKNKEKHELYKKIMAFSGKDVMLSTLPKDLVNLFKLKEEFKHKIKQEEQNVSSRKSKSQ